MSGDPIAPGESGAEDAPLKLRAHDLQDMDVIAALLQDALVPLGDMTYLAEEKRFILVANRFRWHGDPAEDRRPAAPAPQPEGEDAAFDDAGHQRAEFLENPAFWDSQDQGLVGRHGRGLRCCTVFRFFQAPWYGDFSAELPPPFWHEAGPPGQGRRPLPASRTALVGL